jgi:membrane-associated PAP2 superfamily phosphatase
MLPLRNWRRLVGWPGIAFALVLGTLILGHFDRPIASALFYSPESGWLGAGGGDWWAHHLIHDAGRWLPRGLVAVALAGWLASYKIVWLARWRRELAFVFFGMALVVVVVGLLKEVTNVDCPWALSGYGGSRPYVLLFGDRPDALPRAACFPGAHASSGFALLAFFFALRERARKAALVMLGVAVTVGVVFAIGQEARGAHFLSHDVTAAALAWFLLAFLYSKTLAPRPQAYK